MKAEGEGDKKNSQNFDGKPWLGNEGAGDRKIGFLKLSVGGYSAELRTVVDIRIELQCCVWR